MTTSSRGPCRGRRSCSNGSRVDSPSSSTRAVPTSRCPGACSFARGFTAAAPMICWTRWCGARSATTRQRGRGAGCRSTARAACRRSSSATASTCRSPTGSTTGATAPSPTRSTHAHAHAHASAARRTTTAGTERDRGSAATDARWWFCRRRQWCVARWGGRAHRLRQLVRLAHDRRVFHVPGHGFRRFVDFHGHDPSEPLQVLDGGFEGAGKGHGHWDRRVIASENEVSFSVTVVTTPRMR